VSNEQIYRVIERFANKYPITAMAKFYQVSTSGFYAWKNRKKEDKDIELLNMIKECQEKNKKLLGYRRVRLWLQKEKGINVNKKRILRVMRQNNLLSKIRRKRVFSLKMGNANKYENILNRNFASAQPNEKWVSDISEISTPNGKVFLSAIKDLYDDFIVSHVMADRQTYPLVDRTIKLATSHEKTKAETILHTDGGGQYRSKKYKEQTKENNITPSMSAPGTPGDNSPAENFFSTLKTECIYLENPRDPNEAIEMVEEYIQYYCYERIQQDGKTPWERRSKWYEENGMSLSHNSPGK